MKEDITFLRRKNSELNDENLKLKTEIAYLRGNLAVYEQFLKKQGFIAGGEE